MLIRLRNSRQPRLVRYSLSYRLLLSAAVLVVVGGCKSLQTDTYREGEVTSSGEPAYITVQHCLISFNGVPQIGAERSQEEAELLANDLWERAKAGEDFDAIVRQFTDDSPPGIYRMANRGFKSDMSSVVPGKQIYARDGMVPAFGDVGFPLQVGEIGMAGFDPVASPYGWHIIKRLK